MELPLFHSYQHLLGVSEVFTQSVCTPPCLHSQQFQGKEQGRLRLTQEERAAVAFDKFCCHLLNTEAHQVGCSGALSRDRKHVLKERDQLRTCTRNGSGPK